VLTLDLSDADRARLSGRVFAGSRAARADLYLSGSGKQSEKYHARTDAGGGFAIEDMRPGSYEVVVLVQMRSRRRWSTSTFRAERRPSVTFECMAPAHGRRQE
jgi:hypothetical protein